MRQNNANHLPTFGGQSQN